MPLFAAAILCLVLLMPSAAYADGFGLGLSAEGALVLPLNDWAKVAGPGFGFLIRGEKELRDNLHVSARIGYIQSSNKESENTTANSTHIPLLGGIKYQLLPKLFVTAEAGFFWNQFQSTVQETGFSTDHDDSGVDLALNLGAGYHYRGWDFRGHFLCPDLADLGEMNGFLITVGYQFITF